MTEFNADTPTSDYGHLSAAAVGVLLKEMVRRAIEAIQAQLFTFESQSKDSPFSDKPDFVTTADRTTQEIYLRLIQRCFPGYGVIAEEDEHRIPCSLAGANFCITVDPLDGTKAFMRRQSYGVGTMVSLLRDEEIISAYVGDVMTRELYGFRPQSNNVHRISQYNIGRKLQIDPGRPLSNQVLLVSDPPRSFSERVRRILLPEILGCTSANRPFRSFEITSGSIGIEFSRLWKGEVGGLVVRQGPMTPWDFCPVFGISRKLGFVFLGVYENELRPIIPAALRSAFSLERECLIVHQSRIDELRSALYGTDHTVA
jgi:fructose-1,6-bisphosphatase/inositol monophosphatase family enzyme